MNSVEKYFLQQKVNLNNTDSFDSVEISKRIEEFRERMKVKYSWKDGEILFFPNAYYAKRTLFENHRDKKMYSNDIDPYTMEGYDFRNISERVPNEPSLIFHKGKMETPREENTFIFVELAKRAEETGDADAFVVTPIYGFTMLGYRGKLVPQYLGPHAISEMNRSEYVLREDSPKAFECGTGNYPLILFLMDVLGW